MDADSLLDQLLDEWEEAASRPGGPPSVDEFLASKSEQLLTQIGHEFRRKVRDLAEVDGLLAGESGEGPGVPPPPGGVHPDPVLLQAAVEVQRLHARGGLGEVYLALDCRLGREIALKAIQVRHAAAATGRGWFLQEAKVTGRLEHPGIVPVYGLGHLGDGRPCYAMRFIRGQTLTEAIRRLHQAGASCQDATPGGKPAGRAWHPDRMLELRKLLARFKDVCDTIGYAHSRGVLHCDIKPDNIMLGDYGETLVVDWGLARRFEPSGTPASPASTGSTSEGIAGQDGDSNWCSIAGGTPSFMSPEQAGGDGHLLGPRSDVYSLGVTLYHLLTGRTPFPGDSSVEVLEKVREGQFPRPREVDAACPLALEAVCRKGMATRAEDRYGSCAELAEDIERWLADEPVSARREWWPTRARRWAKRHRTFVSVVACGVLLATLFLAILAASLRISEGRERAARELAEQRESEARAARLQAEKGRRAAVESIERLTAGLIPPALDRQAYEDLVDRAFEAVPEFFGKDMIRGKLRDNPEVAKAVLARTVDYAAEQWLRYLESGKQLREGGEYEASLHVYGRAIASLLDLAVKGKESKALRGTLCSAYQGRATSGGYGWKALCLLRMERRADALKIASEWARKQAPKKDEVRRLVRLHSLAAESLLNDRSLAGSEREKQSEEQAALAIRWLSRGVRDRALTPSEATELISADPDLQFIKGRVDIAKLLSPEGAGKP
jgi:serine/threonine protein kinase